MIQIVQSMTICTIEPRVTYMHSERNSEEALPEGVALPHMMGAADQQSPQLPTQGAGPGARLD